MYTCSKTYFDIPFAHRQHRHAGRCSKIHGHNWSVTVTFACRELDEHGFVVDFGGLRYLKDWLDEHLDHACVLAADDPLKDTLVAAAPDAWRVYEIDCPSCEGVARHLFEVFDGLVKRHEGGRVWVKRVHLEEDRRNAATYEPDG